MSIERTFRTYGAPQIDADIAEQGWSKIVEKKDLKGILRQWVLVQIGDAWNARFRFSARRKNGSVLLRRVLKFDLFPLTQWRGWPLR